MSETLLKTDDPAAEALCQERRQVLLSEEECVGLRRILNTPKAPTDALKSAFFECEQSSPEHPHADR